MRLWRRRKLRVPCRTVLGSLLLVLLVARPAGAHKGPPFPLLMDQAAAGYSVSVWADPDIGDAFFYVVVETPAGKPPKEPLQVSMWTEPISGRLEKETYEATRVKLRNRVQFEARPYFDQGDMWNIGFRIKPVGGEVGELVAQVESTPPGLGPWDLAIYLFPFLFLGGMWVLAMVRRMRAARRLQEVPKLPQGAEPLHEPALVTSDAKDSR